MMNTTTKLKL